MPTSVINPGGRFRNQALYYKAVPGLGKPQNLRISRRWSTVWNAIIAGLTVLALGGAWFLEYQC